MAISDEVYESLVFDGQQHVSLATLPGMRERTITVGSLSKTYAMTGWRVGYLAAPQAVVSEALKLSQYSITNVAPFVQRAAVVALTDDSVCQFVEESRQIYSARRDLLVDELQRVPQIRVMEPQGAFYIMIDISSFSLDSIDFATRLLDEERLCLVPGVGFGKSAEGKLRMTFAAAESELLEGVRRLRRMVIREFGRQESRAA
jgi:aminotransferase